MREGLAQGVRQGMYYLRQQISSSVRRPTRAEIERWIAEPRFRTFLEAADGDAARAMELYDWNVYASAVFLETISYGEVMLRNAIDAQFPPLNHSEPAAQSWLADSALMSERSLEIVSGTIARIERTSKEATRARLVSNLSFGFWRALFNKRYKQLWISSLHGGFPNGTGDRSEVAQLMSRLNSFRNRIAHHESIVNVAIRQRYDDLMALVGLVDLAAADWLESRSRVRETLACRPR